LSPDWQMEAEIAGLVLRSVGAKNWGLGAEKDG
jgi:hypothetical protein